MHFFFGGFCLLAERGNLDGHICGFEQVLKAKVLAFGTFAKSFFAFQGTKLFFFFLPPLRVLGAAAAEAQREWKMHLGNILEKFSS